MGPERRLKWGICLFLALILTGAGYFLDKNRQKKSIFQHSHFLAAQIHRQVEGLMQRAIQQGKSDPLGLALQRVTQKDSDAVYRVFRTAFPGKREEKIVEDYDPYENRYDGVFRMSLPENTIRIQISWPKWGYLGAQNEIQTGIFLAFTFLFWTILLSPFTRYPRSTLAPMTQKRFKVWIHDSKGLLTQLSETIRKLVQDSKTLLTASYHSQKELKRLKDTVQKRSDEIQKLIHETEFSLEFLEKLKFQSKQIEEESAQTSEKLEGKAKEFSETMSQLSQQLSKFKKRMRELESEFEPLSQNVNTTFEQYQKILSSTEDMKGHILETTTVLRDYARRFEV